MADSHKALPTVTASAADLAIDLAPFRTLADAKAAMTAHVCYTAQDESAPATLSAKVIAQIVRGTISFGGLLLSDDLDMQALTGTIRTRRRQAPGSRMRSCAQLRARMDDMVGIAAALAPMSAETQPDLDRALADTDIAPSIPTGGRRN
jgi:beta-N-acetylhexosaminidase